MPESEGRAHKIILITVLLFFSQIKLCAAFDDGFASAKKIAGMYFVACVQQQLETISLIQQLNVSLSDKLMVGKSAEKKHSPEAELADMLDTLYIRVCDILDMHLYSFQGNIKICLDRAQLNKIYRDMFNKDLQAHSFYVNDLNTIYVSADNFRREIVGHEIAHAVISHYFVVSPSVKIHEVLAMYVEYQLRKGGE